MNIYTVFEQAAEKYPEHIAIINEDKRCTYLDLLQAVHGTAAYFRAQGVEPGHRVLVFVPMGIDLYRVTLALFKIGATAVFLDEWVSWKRMELCSQLAECQAFVGIWKARILAWFSRPLRSIPIHLNLGYSPQVHADTYPAPDHQSALITFTTGSTGTPKAANRTHGFLKVQFDALLEEIDPQPHDVDMTTLPIVLLINLGVGATSVIANFKPAKPESMNAGYIVAQLQKQGVNRMTASPYFVERLATYVRVSGDKLPQLKKVFTGGGPVFPTQARELQLAFRSAAVKIAYGSTEVEPISLIAADTLAQNHDLVALGGLPVGAPYRQAEVRIIPIVDEPLTRQDLASFEPLAPLDVGEIIVAGPHVLSQYYKNDEAFRRNKIVDGQKIWHRTGDSGFLDANGYLYLTGRCAQVFHHGEQLVCPFVLEYVLKNIKGVAIGTVIQDGAAVQYLIELTPSTDKSMVEAALTKLGIVPYTVRFLDRMPRDKRHHSKIDYGAL